MKRTRPPDLFGWANARDEQAEAHRAQANALEIEAGAKRRLADEYDAAQERGEVQRPGGDRTSIVPEQNNAPATVEDIGLTRKQVHEARQIRDEEKPARVVNFHERRAQLGRWQLFEADWWMAGMDRALDRKYGKIPPAPVLPFPRRHPASPGSYSPGPITRSGT